MAGRRGQAGQEQAGRAGVNFRLPHAVLKSLEPPPRLMKPVGQLIDDAVPLSMCFSRCFTLSLILPVSYMGVSQKSRRSRENDVMTPVA